MIAAIPTEYKGIRFRSRLEAKWALFFDAINWPWYYEPIDLDGYIPDFILPFKKPLLIEVKPVFAEEEMHTAVHKIWRSGWSDNAVVVGAGFPFAGWGRGSDNCFGTYMMIHPPDRRCDMPQSGPAAHGGEGYVWCDQPRGHVGPHHGAANTWVPVEMSWANEPREPVLSDFFSVWDACLVRCSECRQITPITFDGVWGCERCSAGGKIYCGARDDDNDFYRSSWARATNATQWGRR